MTTNVAAVLTGRARPFGDDGETSAIDKHPVDRPVRIELLGLVGDEQADLSVHGGVDKAIHHYPRDHYTVWSDTLGDHALLGGPGAFGENISTYGLVEDEVCVGDRFRLGTALVEVSQGRQPCWKLDRRFDRKGISATVVRTRRSGWYYRVLEPGSVCAGDAISLVERPWPKLPVSRVFGLLIAGDGRRDPGGLRELGAVDALAESWKVRLAKFLA